MEYKYEFGTDSETIKVSKRWHRILKTFDRLENNQDSKQRYHCWHIEALKYEGSELGKNDIYFEWDFDKSPPFQYAYEKLTSRQRDVIFRRVINGEMFADIGKTYDMGGVQVCNLFHRACDIFRRHYINGVWLYSKENISQPEKDRIRDIPSGLTVKQVLEIRKLRYEYKSIKDISMILNIGETLVTNCLRMNPISETSCPQCSQTIKQSEYGQMQVFCSEKCRRVWFRNNVGENSKITHMGRPRIELSDEQRIAADFYRQIYLTQKEVQELLNLSETILTKYYHSNPPPYTLCKYCGVKIPGEFGKRSPMYCSDKCRFKHKEIARKNKRNNIVVEVKPTPMPEQIFQAVALKRNTQKSYKRIAKLTGLRIEDLEIMFMFE